MAKSRSKSDRPLFSRAKRKAVRWTLGEWRVWNMMMVFRYRSQGVGEPQRTTTDTFYAPEWGD